jgi:hypothetical protein
MLEIVAGIVLPEPPQPVPDPPVGQDDLEPEHEVARVAIAQHVHAARVGREIAADHAAALSAETQWKEAVDFVGGLLDGREDDAGFGGQRIVERIDVADAVQPRERDDDLVRSLARHRRHAHPGVAALRNDRRPGFRAELHDRGDFPGIGRTHHGGRRAHVDAAPVLHVRFDVSRLGEDVLRADDAAEPFDD